MTAPIALQLYTLREAAARDGFESIVRTVAKMGYVGVEPAGFPGTTAEEAGKLPDALAVMVIEDWQSDLRKVTPRIVWTDPESGEQKTYEKHIFLHLDRRRGE